MRIKAFFSRKTDDWKTPSYIYEQALKLGLFDPCPFQSEADGLAMDWKERNFVNPPYSQIKKWVEKSIEQRKKGHKVLLLIPARTDTKAFRLLYDFGAEFYFIEGRLKFNDSNPAPFPSMIVNLCGGGV